MTSDGLGIFLEPLIGALDLRQNVLFFGRERGAAVGGGAVGVRRRVLLLFFGVVFLLSAVEFR